MKIKQKLIMGENQLVKKLNRKHHRQVNIYKYKHRIARDEQSNQPEGKKMDICQNSRWKEDQNAKFLGKTNRTEGFLFKEKKKKKGEERRAEAVQMRKQKKK